MNTLNIKLAKYIKLKSEKDILCGDGTGKITSHSIHCKCKEIDKKLEELSKDMTTRDIFEGMKVINRLPEKLQKLLIIEGWSFLDYAMEKIYKGYPLVIEFCIGDFCVYPCSKKGHWLLEKKVSCESWLEAYIQILSLQTRIDNNTHWQGEED